MAAATGGATGGCDTNRDYGWVRGNAENPFLGSAAAGEVAFAGGELGKAGPFLVTVASIKA